MPPTSSCFINVVQVTKCTLLRIKIQNLDFSGAQLNLAAAGPLLRTFLLTAHSSIKNHEGTIVSCSGDTALALWRGNSPMDALACAEEINKVCATEAGWWLCFRVLTSRAPQSIAHRSNAVRQICLRRSYAIPPPS